MRDCPEYPYFQDSHFSLVVVLNVTLTPYTEAAFKTGLSAALSLGDTERIYILGEKDDGNGTRRGREKRGRWLGGLTLAALCR